MRIAWLAVALLACKKAEPPAPRVTPVPEARLPPADAAVAPAPAPVEVDLLRTLPTTVRVSSTVANPKIVPAHLVDRDLGTAWNSATGKAVGSWIEVEVPGDAAITKLRMTPGFTGRGPAGEDYFTMNPRIKTVVVTAGSTRHTFHLDIEKRELQTFEIDTLIDVRIEITEIVPGTRRAWREAPISELEVWGPLPPGWVPPATPYVPFVAIGEEVLTNGCEETDKLREEFLEKDKDVVYDNYHHQYAPDCEVWDVGKTRELATPWSSAAAWCEIGDEVFGPRQCYVRFTQAGITALATVEGRDGEDKVSTDATVEALDILPDGGDEAIVRFSRPALDGYVRIDEWIVVCRAAPKLACSNAILVASDDWRPTLTFERGAIVLTKGTGEPPAGVLGRHPLIFK